MPTKALRDPEFGNTWRLNQNSVVHRTVSGELRATQVGIRPTFESFSVVIRALSLAQIQRFKAFVIATAGQEINMTDFEQRGWKGIILDQDLTITRYKLSTDCLWQVSFGFEGTVISAAPTQPPDETLTVVNLGNPGVVRHMT